MPYLMNCKVQELGEKGIVALISVGVETAEELASSSSDEILNKFKKGKIAGYGKSTIEKWVTNAGSDKMLECEAVLRHSKLKQRVAEDKRSGVGFTPDSMINENDFCEWYVNEVKSNGGKCFYCDITQLEGVMYYEYLETNKIRTPWGNKGGKSTRGKTLEIDRMDNKLGYLKGNLALSCYYCNNAKSDVFEPDTFKSMIGPEIAKVIRSKI